jgi:hypothetical protein
MRPYENPHMRYAVAFRCMKKFAFKNIDFKSWTCSTDVPCDMNYLFIFKIQMIDPTT